MTLDDTSDKDLDEALARWLGSELGLKGAVTLRQVTGGLSNITSIATDAEGRRVVLRRPPAGEHHGGAHDVLREARILSALEPSDLPTPRVLASVQREVLSTPFYVMDFVDGAVLATTDDAQMVPAAQRRGLGFDLIRGLASVQKVDLDEVGLGDFRRSTSYVERQLRRWNAQWERGATREVPAVRRAGALLAERVKEFENVSECLVHGDFRLGNVMVADPRGNARIAAVMDWELTTAGHPLADLGYLGARMTAPAEVLLGGADPLCAQGYPSFEELASEFAAARGVLLDDLPYFVALNAWRWAVMVEGVSRRLSAGGLGGVSDDPSSDAGWHRHRVELLGQFALDLLA